MLTLIANTNSNNTIPLAAGKVLSLTGSTTATGVAYRLNAALGGTNSLQSWVIADGETQVGPYAADESFLVTCASGSIDIDVVAFTGGAVASVNNETGTVVLTAADVGAVPAPYEIGAVHIDGTNSYLINPSLECTDSGAFSFSLWVLVQTAQAGKTIWQVDGADTYGSDADTNSGDCFNAMFFNADKSQSFNARTEPGSLTTLAWHHIMGTVLTDQAAGEKIRKLYIDDEESSASLGADVAVPFQIAMNGLPFTFGDDTFGDGLVMDVADVWIAPNLSLLTGDQITIATRRKFINADGGPVDLGANGETPTGTAPSIFFHAEPGGEVATFPLNRGTGGAFTVVGSLAAADSSPSDNNDFGFANPMTTAGDLIIGGTAGAPSRLAAGTEGQVLTMVSGVPTWV